MILEAATITPEMEKKLNDAGFVAVVRWTRPAKSDKAFKTREALALIDKTKVPRG